MHKPLSQPLRAVVIAPFFSAESATNRPRVIASVVASLMPVDIVTTDFDHLRKKKCIPVQCAPFNKIVYIETSPYKNNVSAARFISHLRFAFRAAAYFSRHCNEYGVVYTTLPLNLLSWLILTRARGKLKITDTVDIWPDVLPFPSGVRKMLWPLFGVWKWLFKSSIRKSDLALTVSDSFLQEVSNCATQRTHVRRFYIGCGKLDSDAPKHPKFTIVYVGNIGRLYDFETMLDVLSSDNLRTTTQLFLIGKGDREEWLIAELTKREISFRHFGVVYNDARLAEILGPCHVGFNGYLNSSASFSYKAATYFAAGLPILNSMSGDLQRLVEEQGLGQNYEAGNRTELRKCVLNLQENGTSRLADNCRRFFSSQLEIGTVSDGIKTCLVEGLKSRFER
jgi:hypothetical protein